MNASPMLRQSFRTAALLGVAVTLLAAVAATPVRAEGPHLSFGVALNKDEVYVETLAGADVELVLRREGVTIFQGSGVMPAGGFALALELWAEDPPVDVLPGDEAIVTASLDGASTTVTHVVLPVEVTLIDVEGDRVAGTASTDPYADPVIEVAIHGPDGEFSVFSVAAPVGPDGRWEAHLEGFDLTPETMGSATQWWQDADEYRGATQFEFVMPSFRLVWTSDGTGQSLRGWYWPSWAEVTFTAGGHSETVTAPHTDSLLYVPWDPSWPSLEPGLEATVSSGPWTKTTVIPPASVEKVRIRAGIVLGRAAPRAEGTIIAYRTGPYEGVELPFRANPQGRFWALFGRAGYDLAMYDHLEIIQFDSDGDSTSFRTPYGTD